MWIEGGGLKCKRVKRFVQHSPPSPMHFSELCEKSDFLLSRGSMFARMELKGIDGELPPNVDAAA
jgi:hypothetical protein